MELEEYKRMMAILKTLKGVGCSLCDWRGTWPDLVRGVDPENETVYCPNCAETGGILIGPKD